MNNRETFFFMLQIYFNVKIKEDYIIFIHRGLFGKNFKIKYDFSTHFIAFYDYIIDIDYITNEVQFVDVITGMLDKFFLKSSDYML